MSSVDKVGEAANWGLGVIRRLRPKLLALQHLLLDHVVDVNELVVVGELGELALEQAVLRAGSLGIIKLAKLHGVGVGTVQRIKVALAA